MASDSRISLSENSYTDVAIKTLCVPCRIHWPEEGHKRGEELFDLGLSVSGSHINSFVIKETLSEVFRNMQIAPGYSEVSMDKITKIFFVAYENLSKKICETALARKGIAEIHLAGFCWKEERYKVFKFSTDESNNTHKYEEVLTETSFSASGTGKARALELLENGGAPIKVLRDVIESTDIESVGGPLQYARFECKKFKVFANCKLEEGNVVYERGGLNLNDSRLHNSHDDIFVSMPMIDFVTQT
ncbi:hypothetical protein [Parvibaculum sp.]|uniref:hypothetical protein n=1 Tax=Parvibaculum sp. TaxID=2024848 RepID=UPI0025D7FA01|nr:hypothetical protein [Parvibaculum sp.]